MNNLKESQNVDTLNQILDIQSYNLYNSKTEFVPIYIANPICSSMSLWFVNNQYLAKSHVSEFC